MSITVILIEKDKYATELGHIENAIMQLRTQEKKWNAELCRFHTEEDKLMNVQKRNAVQFAHVMKEIDRYYNTPSVRDDDTHTHTHIYIYIEIRTVILSLLYGSFFVSFHSVIERFSPFLFL